MGKHVGLNATRLQGYEALRNEWKAVHQASRQWGMMEVDALTKGKGKSKAKGKDKSKGKGKEKGKDKGHPKSREASSDKSNMKCFFCKEKGHTRKDCPKFSAWLAWKKQVGHEPSANAIEEAGWILALTFEPTGGRNDGATRDGEELCELIMMTAGHRSMSALEVTDKRMVCDTRNLENHC